jgi:RimJ/RimL family protein N-acetyltransferase
MEVRTVNENKMNLFTSLDENPKGFERTVKRLWNHNLSSPYWCFIIKEKGNIIGRVGFWAINNDNKVARIFGLSLPWKSNKYIKTGEKLLKDSFRAMKDYGFVYIDSQLVSLDEKFLLNKRLYENIGMEVVQSKYRFKTTTQNYNYSANNRLSYKPIKDVGKDFFIEMIRKVTKKTLDSEDIINIGKNGELEAAQKHYDSLSSIEHSPENWFLAYNNSEVVGLIVPQILINNNGAINYIGVVPEKRGNGYLIDLLDKGIRNLIKRNVNEIIADIDIENYPMKTALTKMNFEEKFNLINYRIKL